jgi:hypothetical protein
LGYDHMRMAAMAQAQVEGARDMQRAGIALAKADSI